MKLLWPAQASNLDNRTISELGLPAELLMETAGRGVAAAVVARTGAIGRDRLVTVLCGAGNNGGDGFVVARELADRGYRIHAYAVGDRERLSDAAKLHLATLEASGIKPRWYNGPLGGGDLKALHRSLLRSTVIIDALLGVGPTTELREPMRTWVGQLDGRHEALTVAIDIPSGLCARTGTILGAAAKADVVVCIAAAKPGLWLGDGPSCHRAVEVVEIGVPRRWIAEATPAVDLIDDAMLAALLPPRSALGHKGQFGHLLVVAGSPGRSGAALLTSQAALRGGVGACTLATGGEVRARLEGQVPDLMVEAIRGGAAEAARVLRLLDGKAAVVAGPGMGTSSSDIDLLVRLCDGAKSPIVLDADALRILADRADLAEPVRGRLVLTPHPGEMAALLGTTIEEVEVDRVASARVAAERWQAVVISKGARTIIAAPDGAIAICPDPQVALAVAGSGDVLSGLVGALLAQGMAPFAAAVLAVGVHNRAGAAVAERIGARASNASDLLDEIGGVWMRLDKHAAS
jgi:ADP-dependent NAD(P)H-hydrate dehydratase / NAD(P)H-hydrate epimerase